MHWIKNVVAFDLSSDSIRLDKQIKDFTDEKKKFLMNQNKSCIVLCAQNWQPKHTYVSHGMCHVSPVACHMPQG